MRMLPGRQTSKKIATCFLTFLTEDNGRKKLRRGNKELLPDGLLTHNELTSSIAPTARRGKNYYGTKRLGLHRIPRLNVVDCLQQTPQRVLPHLVTITPLSQCWRSCGLNSTWRKLYSFINA
ncbi:hypothetical protein CHS0354_027655 [Potamilus streckersoni]|uniref:Uncharacterized protein n=1 Tax=Potamilus streckersoni TaxID=2493646 RepID=A0AAE0T0L7_9BIVA|nr:hypothetical protein CHS0354_027655 [Potamilus streckersoni]